MSFLKTLLSDQKFQAKLFGIFTMIGLQISKKFGVDPDLVSQVTPYIAAITIAYITGQSVENTWGATNSTTTVVSHDAAGVVTGHEVTTVKQDEVPAVTPSAVVVAKS